MSSQLTRGRRTRPAATRAIHPERSCERICLIILLCECSGERLVHDALVPRRAILPEELITSRVVRQRTVHGLILTAWLRGLSSFLV